MSNLAAALGIACKARPDGRKYGLTTTARRDQPRGLFLDGGGMRFEGWDGIEAGDVRPWPIVEGVGGA